MIYVDDGEETDHDAYEGPHKRQRAGEVDSARRAA